MFNSLRSHMNFYFSLSFIWPPTPKFWEEQQLFFMQPKKNKNSHWCSGIGEVWTTVVEHAMLD